MDLEDEIFGSPEKETPIVKKESIRTPSFVSPRQISSKPSLLDLEDEIFSQEESQRKESIVHPKKLSVLLHKKTEGGEKINLVPPLNFTHTNSVSPRPDDGTPKKLDSPKSRSPRKETHPKKDSPKNESPKLTEEQPIRKESLISPKSRGKKSFIDPNLVQLTENEKKQMTTEEQEQVRRVRLRTMRKSTKIVKHETNDDDFDGLEYIRAVRKEGYLVKPNSDGSKAYKRYCVADKLEEGKILFYVWSSKKAMKDGDPIQKFVITEDVYKESNLFKTSKKSTSYSIGREFHICLVFNSGNKEPMKFWVADEFDAKEWELTLRCMLYFDEDSDDDDSDSEDDEKTAQMKKERRRKRKIQKLKEKEERKKKAGCLGKLWEVIKE